MFLFGAALVGAALRPAEAARAPCPNAADEAEAEIALRLIEAEAEAAELGVRYKDQHPTFVAASARVAALERLAAPNEPRAKYVQHALARRLADLLARTDQRAEEIAKVYLEKHPNTLAIKARRELIAARLAALGAAAEAWQATGGQCAPDPMAARLAQARLRGRLAYLLTRLGDKHPEVVSARADLERLDAEIASEPALSAAQRRDALALLASEIDRRRVRRDVILDRNEGDDSNVRIEDWIIDALAMTAVEIARSGR